MPINFRKAANTVHITEAFKTTSSRTITATHQEKTKVFLLLGGTT